MVHDRKDPQAKVRNSPRDNAPSKQKNGANDRTPQSGAPERVKRATAHIQCAGESETNDGNRLKQSEGR